MKKILDVLDPRRSRSRAFAASPENRIHISNSEETFGAHQLQQALKAANNLSSKNKIDVTVTLPPCVVPVKGSITLASNVQIRGQRASEDEDKVSSEVSRITLAAGATFVIKGGNVRIANLIVTASEKTKPASPIMTVSQGAGLEITECVLDTGDVATSDLLGFSVQGSLTISGSLLTNWRVEVEKTGVSNFSNTQFLNKINQPNSEVPNSCGIMFANGGNQTVTKCEIANYATAVHVEAMTEETVVKFEECNISSLLNGIVVDSSTIVLDHCEFAGAGETCITGRNQSVININDSTLKSECAGCIRIDTGAITNISNTSVLGSTEAGKDSNGIEVIEDGQVNISKSMVNDFSGYGILVKGQSTNANVIDTEISGNQNGGTLICQVGRLVGENITMKNNSRCSIELLGEGTECEIKTLEIRDGDIGVSATTSKGLRLSNVKCFDLRDVAYRFVDSSVEVATSHVNHEKSKSPGMIVVFKESNQEKVLLRDCKMQCCSEGIKVEQVNVLALKRKSANMAAQPLDAIDTTSQDEQDPMYEFGEEYNSSNARAKQRKSKADLENCSFIMCEVGFSVNGAKAVLKGCSFIMNFKHSVFIQNLALQNGPHVRKLSKLKVRWPNYVEPHIDNGSALSNEQQLLTSVTQEKAFCGSADFEPVMYLPTLTERIRQARNIFRSREEDSVPRARVIMRSVSHMLILLKQLTDRLLQKQLLDDPDLGMFAATFNLYEEKRENRSNTLIDMKELFSSWKKLSRTRLFDSALFALNEAFETKQVNEDLYDEYVTPLEEMQRVCFVNSKYNRRRDYLLTTAKENPLTTWYFLDKEDPNTEEGKRLRAEVLRFLAADGEEHRVHNKANFHASWVAQWAVNMLGKSFATDRIPDKLSLRRAWADKLLDEGRADIILQNYKSVENSNSYNTELDQLMKFEALVQFEHKQKLNQEQIQLLGSILGGGGFEAAVRVAGKMFTGEGALPGFLRRVVATIKDADKLLAVLSHINEDPNMSNIKLKRNIILAVMSHFYTPDSQEEPTIYRQIGEKYETCPSCLVQKLQPWNELHLDRCKSDHRFCRNCLKLSMSTGVVDLWGRCPGATDGVACSAIASRREMELAGMDQDKIYNILNVRVTKELQSIPGWRSCDSPGCIGGKVGGNKAYYTCQLCRKMVTPDDNKSDPTVKIRLLNGLDGSTIARGQGIFRECYWCAVTYEKGNACSTITCSHCNKQFSMTYGPDKITHRFDEEGVLPQMYVPKVEGELWKMDVFKNRKGQKLELGQKLTPAEAAEVVRRAKLLVNELEG